jgi:hypothetical protein
MTDGIYTLANDFVYDQLVALLNSIEVNAGRTFPVYVIAYDDKVERIQAEIATRPNVFLLNDSNLFKRWEDFSLEVWKAHPTALSLWQEKGISGVNRIGMNRRYCAFDLASPLERFIYLDADTLVLGPLEPVFSALDTHEFVTYDFQYKDPAHIYNLQSSKLLEIFDENRLKTEIFCAGFYASKKGLLGQEQRDWLVTKLQEGEAEILYTSAPNQSVLNYMVMRSQIPVHNLALHWSEQQRTGNAVTSSHFQMQDDVLYDRGRRLTYLHYIGVSSSLFRRLCAGEDVDFSYRDVFLHYRYLHKPEERPQVLVQPKTPKETFNLAGRVLRKIGLSR